MTQRPSLFRPRSVPPHVFRRYSSLYYRAGTVIVVFEKKFQIFHVVDNRKISIICHLSFLCVASFMTLFKKMVFFWK